MRLGLRANARQFSLLVVVNAFVGAMVGMERSILPAIAEQEFQLAARTAVLSFIVVFGIAKALTNYGAGRLSDHFGRKHLLVAGWLVAGPGGHRSTSASTIPAALPPVGSPLRRTPRNACDASSPRPG